MSFWEKWKEFDKSMSEPALIFQWSKDEGPSNELLIKQEETKRLQLENERLKMMLDNHKIIELLPVVIPGGASLGFPFNFYETIDPLPWMQPGCILWVEYD